MAVARDRLLIATDLSHERKRNHSQEEPLSDDDDEGPPRKASKQNSSTQFCGGFKSHHMLTFPSTANKKYPQSLQGVSDGQKKRHQILLQRVWCSSLLCTLFWKILFEKLNWIKVLSYIIYLVLLASHKCSECKEKIE